MLALLQLSLTQRSSLPLARKTILSLRHQSQIHSGERTSEGQWRIREKIWERYSMQASLSFLRWGDYWGCFTLWNISPPPLLNRDLSLSEFNSKNSSYAAIAADCCGLTQHFYFCSFASIFFFSGFKGSSGSLIPHRQSASHLSLSSSFSLCLSPSLCHNAERWIPFFLVLLFTMFIFY